MVNTSNGTFLAEKSSVAWEPGRATAARAARPVLPQPELSIVVPTRNEAGNIATLVARLEQALPQVSLEIIFVDDSDDETPTVVETVRDQVNCAVKLIHRPVGQRDGGLGGAVVAGLSAAESPWVCVMDGDLQHPPELVPQMFGEAKQSSRDLVVASRYTIGGGPSYVTMANLPQCRAIDAPAEGWSAEAGGAASDLPDEANP